MSKIKRLQVYQTETHRKIKHSLIFCFPGGCSKTFRLVNEKFKICLNQSSNVIICVSRMCMIFEWEGLGT